ncbi:MAG: SLOG family protein [Candidatus Onthomonas sp.]
MRKKIACVIGAEITPFEWKSREEQFQEQFMEKLDWLRRKYGITNYMCGMRRGGELSAAELICRQKRTDSTLTLTCVAAWEEMASAWGEGERNRYFSTFEQCDQEILFQGRYSARCQENCNHYLIDCSDIVLLIRGEDPRELARCTNYARRRKKRVVTVSAERNQPPRLILLP